MSSSTRMSVQASMLAPGTVSSSMSTVEIMPTSARNMITMSEEVANSFTQTSYIQFGSLWETFKTVTKLSRVAMVENGECVICLEEWRKGDMETELPCKHKYHLECVKKWLKIHATCPQCRYKMPLEAED